MRARYAVIMSLVLVATMSVATSAFGYDENVPPTGRTCIGCHGVDDPPADPEMESGPHGGYLATTSKCEACHTVHDAPTDGVLLLPEATVKATCEVCHDGTAGGGVYGVVLARTGSPAASDHSIGATNDVPGGSASGDWAYDVDFSDSANNLTCTDCHSPHGSSVVDAFTGDRARSDQYMLLGPTVVSSRLLRQRPTSMPAATASATKYGSDWCGACHVGRLSGSGMPNNHPAESSANPPASGIADLFYYERVARAGEATIVGTMGKTNEGYVMPEPRIAEQAGHDPICQQCHEDARDVPGAFTITGVDGLGGVTDNPRFQTFPHESPLDGLLVEDWRDSNFCLNCHSVDLLP